MAQTSILISTRSNGRRARRVGVAVVATSLVLAACGGDDDPSASPAEAAAAAETAAAAIATTVDPTAEAGGAERVPDGIYRRIVTAADGEALGIDPTFVAEFLGEDGEMPLGLRIGGDGYEILVTNDAGIEEVGDVGSVGYEDEGRLDVVDGLGGRLTIGWAYDDGLLTTELEEVSAPDTVLVWSGEWTLDESAAGGADAQRIPDGTYRRVVTAADGEALGIDPEFVAEFLGPDGELPLGLRIGGDAFEILVTNDAGIEEVGAVGTVDYDEEGRLVTFEECCGETTIIWSYDDGVLVTEAADEESWEPDGLLVVSGEWVSDDAATGATGEGVALAFANPLSDLPTPLVAFLAEARDATGEAITWDVAQSAGPEQEIIASVLAGDIDMAWVGARAFPEFDALLAPMLVDSYELQTAVFEEGIVDRLADTLADRGLKVLAVYPGPLQRAVGVSRSIATAADFEGLEIGLGLIESPPLQVATVEALGATPATFQEHMDISVLDGFIAQIGAVTGNSWENEVASVTSNLNFWPRPLVVFTTVERFEQLDAAIQSALASGGEAAFDAATAAALRDDSDSLDHLCGATAELIELSETDLARIRDELDPVYDELAQDATTAGFIAEITALKDDLGSAPDLANCDAR